MGIRNCYFILLALSLSCFTSCGSTNLATGNDDTVDAGDITIVGETVAVNDVADLPDLDFGTITSISSAMCLPRESKTLGTTLGSSSQAGCIASNYAQPLIISQFQQAEVFMCFVKKVEELQADFAIPTDHYDYYNITVPDIDGSPSYLIRSRLGNFITNNSANFKIESCNAFYPNVPTKSLEASMVGNIIQKKWTGTVVNHFAWTGNPVSMNALQFEIEMSSEDAFHTTYSKDNVSKIIAESIFGLSPTINSLDGSTSFMNGLELDLKYEKVSAVTASPLNTIQGSFVLSGGTSASIFTELASTVGAAKLLLNNSDPLYSTPASGITQAFEITSAGIIAIDPALPSVAAIYDDVNGTALPAILTVPTDINNAVGYLENWNCEAPAGESFIEITPTPSDFADCLTAREALEQTIQNANLAISSCILGN